MQLESTGDTGEMGFDLGASMDVIASEMGKSNESTNDTGSDESLSRETVEGATETAPRNPETTGQVRSAPKSWAKEQHEHWSRLDPKVQEYIELREKQMLDGLDM